MDNEKKKLGVSDLAARTMVVICALNLNGVATMVFDIGRVFSGILLLTSLLLIIKRGRRVWFPPFILFLLAVTIYLLLGLLIADPWNALVPLNTYLQTYIGSILIVWAITGYVTSLRFGQEFQKFLDFVRITFLIAAASVWASPILYTLYVNLPPTAEERIAGFYFNPNDAAYAALIAFALTLWAPYRRRLVQAFLLFLTAGAVVLTFSKSAISLILVIVSVYLFRRTRGYGRFVLPPILLLVIIIIQDLENPMIAIVELLPMELTPLQNKRMIAVGAIWSGTFDESTSSGRSILWAIAIERAQENLLFGSGLGTFHHIVGGLLGHGNVWQGAHNVPLMILGESGIFPLLILAAAMLFVVLNINRLPSEYIDLQLFLIIILFAHYMAGHGALGHRFNNLMLGVVLGMIGAANWVARSSLHSARDSRGDWPRRWKHVRF